MSNIALASHLVTPRTGYQHHGLYTGNGYVIHLTSDNVIEEIPLETFTQGNGYAIQKYHSTFNQNQIVQRARSRLGAEDYSLLFNNCEHFVTWCIHDRPSSKQIQNGVRLGVITPPTVMNVLSANTPTLAGLTLAEITATTGGTTGMTLLSTTPVLPAAIVGYGVYKLVQFLKD
jgi:hypothetical protein